LPTQSISRRTGTSRSRCARHARPPRGHHLCVT
jgi:hypothetical protein